MTLFHTGAFKLVLQVKTNTKVESGNFGNRVISETVTLK